MELEEIRSWCKDHKQDAVEICYKTGISLHWFNAFTAGRFSDPGYTKIKRLEIYIQEQ